MRFNPFFTTLLLSQTSALVVDKPLTRVDGSEAEVDEYLTTYNKDDILPVTKSVSVSTSKIATGTAVFAPPLASVDPDLEPHTEGFVVTTVSNPAETEPPLLTSKIPKPTSLLEPLKTTTRDDSTNDFVKRAASADIFAAPIDTKAPPSMFTRQSNHPLPRTGIKKNGPIGTNKFYANWFLDDQTAPVFTFPYSLAWSGGKGPAASWGMAISHIDQSQRVYGPVEFNDAAKYYLNPIGIQSMIMSAKELGKNTALTTEAMTPYYTKVFLRKDKNSSPALGFHVSLGMMFTTGLYYGSTPQIQSGVFFRSMTKVAKDPKKDVRKYTFVLEDGTTWRLYAWRRSGDPLDLVLVNNGLAQAKKPFRGYIQIAKDPAPGTQSERVLDDGCGIWTTGMTVSGSVNGNAGTYSFKWGRNGHKTGNIYNFALPHHLSSFDQNTLGRVRRHELATTTKGTAKIVLGSGWTLLEPSMPVGMGFRPRHPTQGSKGLSSKAKKIIAPIAREEVSQNMEEQTNLDSMYFSGKALAKFGNIVYVINSMLGDKALGQAGLAKLKDCMDRFTTNKQQYPLYYESAWGGLVSSAAYTRNDPYFDFGNTYYNDHHFHYGYHILAAAYIGAMDSKWALANKDWVNTMVRDIANPSSSDRYFPQWRAFDWYHGHSWAHGLFPSLDGKNQESSSEDIMAAYAIKMWGQVIKDTNMVARANLQLAAMSRSMKHYYMYTKDNTVQPKNFIGNKVAGILFENKVDHTTFFDGSIEAIQGIHMLPLLPASNLARSNQFVKEEWNELFADKIDKINNAWKGIAYGSYATAEPKKAWDFFVSSKFQDNWIDGGASRTWYLAYAGALAGV